MIFQDIIGQKKIVNALDAIIETKKIGHAYLFIGPDGIGKKTISNLFTSFLLCQNNSEGKICGFCTSCKLLLNKSNPDYYLINPDSTTIGIEEIRELQNHIIIKPFYSNKKVYNIINADRMTIQAQNCLLKTLESPPQYAVLLLTTSNENALLDTILSRIVKYRLQKNTKNEVKEFLLKNFNTSFLSDNLDFLTYYSDGVIGNALKIANDTNFISLRTQSLNIILQLLETKTSEIFQTSKFFIENKDNIQSILQIMILFYRDILMIKKTDSEKLLINIDKKDIIFKIEQKISYEKLIRNIEIIENISKNIKQNASYELSIEVLLLKLQEEL